MPRVPKSAKLILKTDVGISEYEIGARILKTLPAHLAGRPTILFADERVGQHMRDLLPGQTVIGLVGGESLKTLAQLETVYAQLARRALPRDGVLVAAGGGTVLDICGLAASTWGRGIEFVAVPTTLLAAVDAAVGGKTGINLGDLKNPVGTFHPARRILVQPELLFSLPRRHWRNGMAELIKTAFIGSASLFRDLEEHVPSFETLLGRGDPRRRVDGIATLPWQSWLTTAAGVKIDLVQRDFREAGPRRALNLGHTLGHALELSGRLDHGQAVALGLAAVSRMAAAQNTCTHKTAGRIIRLLTACGLQTSLPSVPATDIAALLGRDKKQEGSRLGWILPVRPGRVLIDQVVDVNTALDHLTERR